MKLIANCELRIANWLDWRVGRFAWKLENIRRIVQPIPITGQQGLFNVEVDFHERQLEAISVAIPKVIA